MNASWIRHMQDTLVGRLDELHAGIDEVTLTDFPEYANVGDSAIALGQIAYWQARSIKLVAIFSEQLITNSVFNSRGPVAINGGGNIGGLYPLHNEHRYKLAERLPAETWLIQEPQSVHFPTEAHRFEFMQRMAHRRSMRLAVRDTQSLGQLEHGVANLILSPDSAHMLGEIFAPEPEREFVILGRTDGEAKGDDALGAIDWLTDDPKMMPFWQVNKYARRAPLVRPAFHRDNRFWQSRAQQRLDRGIDVLSNGRTIVTNRLHAVLLALQMGRRVVATDNANGKIANYIETWMPDGHPNLDFRPRQDLKDVALELVH